MSKFKVGDLVYFEAPTRFLEPISGIGTFVEDYPSENGFVITCDEKLVLIQKGRFDYNNGNFVVDYVASPIIVNSPLFKALK